MANLLLPFVVSTTVILVSCFNKWANPCHCNFLTDFEPNKWFHKTIDKLLDNDYMLTHI